MAIRKGQFKYLRDLYVGMDYFIVHAGNVEQYRMVEGDHVQVGDHRIYKPRKWPQAELDSLARMNKNLKALNADFDGDR